MNLAIQPLSCFCFRCMHYSIFISILILMRMRIFPNKKRFWFFRLEFFLRPQVKTIFTPGLHCFEFSKCLYLISFFNLETILDLKGTKKYKGNQRSFRNYEIFQLYILGIFDSFFLPFFQNKKIHFWLSMITSYVLGSFKLFLFILLVGQFSHWFCLSVLEAYGGDYSYTCDSGLLSYDEFPP